jgi:hypothetical protein
MTNSGSENLHFVLFGIRDFSAAIAARESVDGSFDSCGESPLWMAVRFSSRDPVFGGKFENVKKMHYGEFGPVAQVAKVNGFRSNSDML